MVAAGTDNPHFWLAYAEDRKAENPAYTICDFREEIRIAGAQQEGLSAPPGTEKPSCHWLCTYRMKLGRIVRPGDCSRCDIPITSREEAEHDDNDL